MDFRETVKRFTEYCNWEIPAIRKEDVNIAIYAIRELQRYRKIGTLEEVREAVEQQRAKEPLLGGNTDKLAGDIRICPCCSGVVGIDDIRADFCAECGQRIDWSEKE